MYPLLPSHWVFDAGKLKVKQPQCRPNSFSGTSISMHVTSFLHQITSKITIWLSKCFGAASKVDHGRHHLLFLSGAILYVTPCLQFRGHNSINMAKACISNSGLFVWEICIRKLMCQTAEGPLTLHALLTPQNKIYCHSKTRSLPHQQDVLIIFWHVSQLHNVISLQIQSLWDSFLFICLLSLRLVPFHHSETREKTTFNI